MSVGPVESFFVFGSKVDTNCSDTGISMKSPSGLSGSGTDTFISDDLAVTI